MGEFADAAEAGVAVAGLLQPWAGRASVVAVVPNGVPVALAAARALGCPVLGAQIERSDEGDASVALPTGLDVTATVIVIDDGVETGRAARLLGRALRDAGVTRLLLGVPVCPRESAAGLVPLYNEVVAVVRPLARRSLDWHYRVRPRMTPAEATAALAAYEAGRAAG